MSIICPFCHTSDDTGTSEEPYISAFCLKCEVVMRGSSLKEVRKKWQGSEYRSEEVNYSRKGNKPHRRRRDRFYDEEGEW